MVQIIHALQLKFLVELYEFESDFAEPFNVAQDVKRVWLSDVLGVDKEDPRPARSIRKSLALLVPSQLLHYSRSYCAGGRPKNISL